MMINTSNDNFRVNDDEVQKKFKLNRLIAIRPLLSLPRTHSNAR
ncbi:hypothetical protein M3J09_005650 [Ascochyta lentis]